MPSSILTLDLWPDTLVALNILRRWEIKLFKIFVNWIYSNCDVILAQSKSMIKEIEAYSSVKNEVYYFPSWGDSDLFLNNQYPAKEIINKKIFTILFAGNIGEAQDFPSIIKAVRHLKKIGINNFRIIFFSEGSKKKWVKREIKRLGIEKRFELYKNYPLEKMSSFFVHADVSLVSLLDRKFSI